ncbi:hypothetical protein GJ699_08740 [Duganella sp. FT80W]|uniref:TniQ domain-containing protein n=1 Tax=Duganella guangzhouensis TaxID=2666084 RepID=A0A6I2KYK7_9BURK|nr:TniQ family protein [Duganella guangzhouensis]MRW90067.1 hypothetical protein [Duganella guangzhouensis]
MNKYSQKKMCTEENDRRVAQLDPIEGLVLDWLPGESLYSLIARNHFLRGMAAPEAVISDFFGTASGTSLHDDLREIDVFARRTEEALGTAEYVLNYHTHYRFYKIFLSGSDKRLIEARRKPAANMLNFPLGLSVGRFRAYHPLKGCPDCVREDQKNIGMSYWRLAHQYPGAWICLEHARPLLVAAPPLAQRQGFHWLTPGMQDFCPLPIHLQTQQDVDNFKWLTEFINALTLNNEDGTIQVAEARGKFQHEARAAGVLTPHAKLRSIHISNALDLSKSFHEFLTRFRRCVDFAWLPSTLDESHSLLSRYASPLRKIQPVEQLLLAAWCSTRFN